MLANPTRAKAILTELSQLGIRLSIEPLNRFETDFINNFTGELVGANGRGTAGHYTGWTDNLEGRLAAHTKGQAQKQSGPRADFRPERQERD